MVMSQENECPRCGAALPSGTSAGQCPRCILQFVAAPQAGDDAADDLQAASEGPGAAIGAYRLLEKIGEGGMAVVYRAEQGEPLRRRVALKIVKLGMDTRQFVARFNAERQALAIMDHPNIARVFDAGATEAGRPYFVMELVRGIPITEYCDRHKLGMRERLELFICLCQAIRHAHEKGIVHRDIKPSNVLVMTQDGKPVPKIIDFGVAKTLHPRLTEGTRVTEQGQFLGTPEYMSPEQAEFGGPDVDARTDIYSLGVLLYELLTGCTPFDPRDLRGRGYAQMQRIICDREPVKPSTKLTVLGEKVADIAGRRSITADQLRRSVRGDLDWIVMKCLEKDRGRRYETAESLATDIERHLNNEPVTAAAPTRIYRTGKYVRRHRRALAVTGAFALVLILATTFGVWQARRAGQAEDERESLRDVRWALGTAMPEIERLLEKDDYTAAFNMAEQARPFVAGDPRFQLLLARAAGAVSIETTPPGALVFLRDYNAPGDDWEPVGQSPIREARVSRGFKRWKIAMPDYESAEGAVLVGSRPAELRVRLDEIGTIPEGMVRIRGGSAKANMAWLDSANMPVLNLPDFLLDRYEVTNRQFKEFVEAGGYEKPEYWKHGFVKDGAEISRQAAMKLFVDRTGRPGPAAWEDGDFPKGQENHPVAGVSWYEAAAYAEFAGKRLPTVYHWTLAAGDLSFVDVGFVIPQSNFRGKGPAAVGTFHGVTSHGVYDMAGNVKEWCFNEAPDGHRVIAGGGWNEPEYMFQNADKYAPCFRAANFGFRCMKLLADDGVWEQAGRPVRYRRLPSVVDEVESCSDEVFEIYRKLYDYGEAELQPVVETAEDVSIYTHRESVTFNAAYGNERMIAYLYLPRQGKPPFQTVIYFPGDGAWSVHSISGYGSAETYESHTRSGRAFVFPVLQGTFERNLPVDQQTRTTETEKWIMRAKDFRRTIDYLETRPKEFDLSKLAYEGLSRGASWGGILPAIEPRIKVAVMFGGGLHLDFPPEYNHANFTPRVAIPVLLQDGKYDFIFPVESSQKPFLRLFGAEQKDKHHKTYETGHSSWLKNEVRKDELEFLDKYFGPAK
jgi:serine/threonine protein kinase/formylglycine-generating enzyme required for sulfatase activity/dienelactone hydrolase